MECLPYELWPERAVHASLLGVREVRREALPFFVSELAPHLWQVEQVFRRCLAVLWFLARRVKNEEWWTCLASCRDDTAKNFVP